MQRVPASAEGAFIAAMLVTIASGARATMIPAVTDLMEGILLTVAVEVVICLLIKGGRLVRPPVYSPSLK